MVRLKVRWIIARVPEQQQQQQQPRSSSEEGGREEDEIKVFRRKLRSTLTDSFGVSTLKVDLRGKCSSCRLSRGVLYCDWVLLFLCASHVHLCSMLAIGWTSQPSHPRTPQSPCTVEALP